MMWLGCVSLAARILFIVEGDAAFVMFSRDLGGAPVSRAYFETSDSIVAKSNWYRNQDVRTSWGEYIWAKIMPAGYSNIMTKAPCAHRGIVHF